MARLNGFKIGTCRPAGAQAEMECLIWNHSEHGALLEFSEPDRRFEACRLHCPELGIDAACRVVWQDGRECGVEYVARAE
ncbi:hypothetical protein [Methylobacterium sp. Leaf118]|uniref:hypothetical protein n=1 Tax=Methylobacterium sp. Leaf118 TaxID=2876562 RepID=UPI001E2DD8BF|nr:hypothetical protein [Methylobacterium sp. Leaf118]